MPRINFHQQLAALKDKLLAMAALSQEALEFSVEAYLARDMALCNHVLEIEEAINAAETTVDEMAYELLAKEQPMAIDLRFILSVIKINGDLERIGDQAANIAERDPMRAVRHLLGRRESSMPARLEIGRFQGDKDVLLLAFDSKGAEISDSCHDSVQGAKDAAYSELGVEEKDWQKVAD